MRQLNIREIKDVNGGFANFVWGAAMGAVSYGVQSAFTRQPTWGGFATSVGIGAVTGGFSSVTAVRAVWGVNRAITTGTAQGIYKTR